MYLHILYIAYSVCVCVFTCMERSEDKIRKVASQFSVTRRFLQLTVGFARVILNMAGKVKICDSLHF